LFEKQVSQARRPAKQQNRADLQSFPKGKRLPITAILLLLRANNILLNRLCKVVVKAVFRKYCLLDVGALRRSNEFEIGCNFASHI